MRGIFKPDRGLCPPRFRKGRGTFAARIGKEDIAVILRLDPELLEKDDRAVSADNIVAKEQARIR